MQLETAQATELARYLVTIADSIKEYYKDSENKKKYREWYLKKYGCEPKEV